MLKNVTRLECIVDGKTAHFYCDNDTPLHVAKEMLFQFQKYVGHVEDNARAQYEAAKEKEEADSNVESKIEELKVE